MVYTHEDALVRVLMPAVASVFDGELGRAKRVEYAIGQDGRVNPAAVQLHGAILVTGQIDDNVYSTTSTVTYAQGPALNAHLDAGSWNVIYVVMTGGSNSAGSSLDIRPTLQGVPGQEVTRVGLSAGRAPFFLYQQMVLPGDQAVAAGVQFKSDSAGTSQLFDTVQLLFGVKQ